MSMGQKWPADGVMLQNRRCHVISLYHCCAPAPLVNEMHCSSVMIMHIALKRHFCIQARHRLFYLVRHLEQRLRMSDKRIITHNLADIGLWGMESSATDG
jgi:hypothetical protein